MPINPDSLTKASPFLRNRKITSPVTREEVVGDRSSKRLTTAKYKDIDLRFEPNASTNGDIARVYDRQAVQQALKTLILTNVYEKPFHPEIGCRIYSLLFGLNPSFHDTIHIERLIRETVLNHEPRVRVLSVEVESYLNPPVTGGSTDPNSINITISYQIVNTQIKEDVTISVQRVR